MSRPPDARLSADAPMLIWRPARRAPRARSDRNPPKGGWHVSNQSDLVMCPSEYGEDLRQLFFGERDRVLSEDDAEEPGECNKWLATTRAIEAASMCTQIHPLSTRRSVSGAVAARRRTSPTNLAAMPRP